MNLKKCRARINELMSRFVAQVKGAIEMDELDTNRVSEDVLIPLLSAIYEHTNLENLNVSEGSNFPAIDLGDKETRTAYQITSTPTSRKIKDTLKKFVTHKLYKEYDHLVIYILTEKQSRYQGKGFDEIIQDKFIFDKKSDIRDYQDLLKEISGFPLEKARKVENVLEQHFGDGGKQDDDEPQDILEWLEQVNNLWEEESGTIKINREELRNDLQDFASRGNGVIIGSPGVGKTYLLKELHQHLKSDEIPHLLLPIDQLGDGTLEDLEAGLSYKGALIERLKSVPVSDKKAILLFDAFDAARDEQTRKRFLNLIQQAIHKLSESWNIIVTVRTYDARKSQELLDLFGSFDEVDSTQYRCSEISCSHFTISPFNEDEILQALDQIECPRFVYNEGSDDFKKILAKPFNLWLLEKILRNLSDKDLTALSQIRSEVQLLDRFWQQRIGNETSERVLRRISHRMVKELSLTVKIDDIYDDVDLDNPVRRTAWDKLQSDEILTKVSSTGQRIAFSHNILFDYAISVLIPDDQPQNFKDFITEDSSLPFFLWPSLTYFFTRLWYYDNSTSFWKVFWYILPHDQSVHLRLVARLIPTSVIANEAHKIDQLKPLLEELRNAEKREVANEAITRLLQSLRMLQIERNALWIDFFDQVSVHLHNEFAWDLATLTSDILERTTDTNIKEACGRIGRRLLEWVWEKRKVSEDDWYNRLGGYWAVPLVAKTYHTNIEDSRALLEKVLQLTNEDNFPISFLSWLTEHVDRIWESDSEFVMSIYHTVFSHQFTGGGETIRGGAVLPITTYRRQDFEMCQYRLVKHFPDFLQAAPLPATQAAVRSLNFFIFQEHTVKTEDIEMFNFRGKPTHFVQDHSYIWDAQISSDEPIELADALFEFIAELARSEEACLDSLLDVFRDEVVVAFFWKRLLKTGSQFPKIFAPRLFELCIAVPIQRPSEAFYELCLFLKAAASDFTPNELLQIEKSILALPSEATDERHRSFLEEDRNRLLAQIPMNLLHTDEAKRIREKMERENDVPENRPPVSFSTSWGSVTEEKWLQTQGVDTTMPENQELQRLSSPLNKFSSDWLNDAPTQEAVRLILPKLQEAYTKLRSNTEADQETINLLWRNLTDCVAILGRIANHLERNFFAFCRQVLLEAAKHEQPKPNPEHDDQFDDPSYSPFPRHKAAEGILRFAFHQSDAEILDAIETLANDSVPSVRMVTAMRLFMVYNKAPNRFWHIMNNRAIHERNHVVQEYLYLTLARVVSDRKENEAKTTRIMTKLLEHTPLPRGKQGLSDPFANLLMWLAIERENPWAVKIIKDRFFKHPSQFANLLTRAVSQVMKSYVAPKYLETPDGCQRAKRGIKWLEKVIDVVSDEIKELYSISRKSETEEIKKKLRALYTVIDQVITRLYFEVAHGRTQSEKSKEENPYGLRCAFYNEVKPLMEQVIDFAQNPEHGLMFAPTAHYFMQLLTSFLNCNSKEVLHLAAGVVKSSERFGYNLDSIAVRDIVEFVEVVLADHRDEVRDGEALEDLLNLLDMFAKTGWPDALKLVWRLDEVFR